MKRNKKAETSCKLGECACGDVVRYHQQCMVVFTQINGRTWIRYVDELTYREISEPALLSPDLDVEVLARGVARYVKQGGAEVDPLRGSN